MTSAQPGEPVTSGSAASAAPSGQCPKCPGGDACWLLRMLPRSAQVKGCSAPEAIAAQREYTRSNRAQRAAQKAAQGSAEVTGGWGSPEIPAPVMLTGETCSECGEQTLTVPGRAGLACPRGHYNPDPEMIRRASVARTVRKPNVQSEVEPSPEEIANLASERGRIVRGCIDALTTIDGSQLWTLKKQIPNFTIPISWNPNIMYELQDKLCSYINQARAARTRDKLTDINTAALSLIYSHAMNMTRAFLNQSFRDAADALNRRNLIHKTTGRTVKCRAITDDRHKPRIEWILGLPLKRTLETAPGRKMITGRIEPPEDDNYENDDYEDDNSEDDDSEDFTPW